MNEAGIKVRLTEPEVAGEYVVASREEDGTLVLRPERERLSDVIAETDGKVLDGAGFAAHLKHVAATEDDLGPDSGSE